MTEQLHNFIESLREELRHYGELLALLETHQAQTVGRDLEGLLPTAEALNAEGQAIQVACRERAQRYRDLARSLGLAPDSRTGYLLPLLPQAHRPLLEALLEESQQLFRRVRQRAQKNHLLLTRSLALMEQFMHSLCDGGTPAQVRPGRAAPRRPSQPG